MNKSIATAVFAIAAAGVAGGLTFIATGGSESAVASTAAPVAAPSPVSVPTPPPPPPPEPVATIEDQAKDAGLLFAVDYEGDRAKALEQFKSSKDQTKDSVLNHLNDPGSAQFKSVYLVEMNGVPVFCGLMNAKNAMGGYVPFRAFYGLGGTVFIDDGSDSFRSTLEETCFNLPSIGDVEDF